MGVFNEAKLRPGYVQMEGGLPFQPGESQYATDLRVAYERGLDAKWNGAGTDVDQYEDEGLRQAFLQGFNA